MNPDFKINLEKSVSKKYERITDSNKEFLNLVEKNKSSHFITNLITYELTIARTIILENKIIFPIIQQGKYWSKEIKKYEHKKHVLKPFPDSYWKNIEGDIKLLVNDRKFCDLLQKSKNNFDECYKNIMRVRP